MAPQALMTACRQEIDKHNIMNKKNSLIFCLVIALFILNAGFLLTKGQPGTADNLALDEQEATVRAIKKVIPSVVSIIVYDVEEVDAVDFVTGELGKEEVKKQKQSGTGFIINSDGYIITNKHVVEAVSDDDAEFRVILNSGKQYYAQLIDKDNAKDIAVLKIFDKDLPFVELADSSKLEQGMTVVAIGNAVGQYQNSVTKGIISGLGRSLHALSDRGGAAFLDNVIQTDASINLGNSGGPLIDLHGRVVGVNTAIDTSASDVGFAIPINDVRPVVQSVIKHGVIKRPRLGVSYIMLTPDIARDNELGRDSGAWITAGDGQDAVLPDSPAEKAGLEKNDVIFEVNAIKIYGQDTLFSVIQRYRPGDRIGLKIQRGGQIMIKVLELDEF